VRIETRLQNPLIEGCGSCYGSALLGQSDMNGDAYYKVKPLIDNLNQTSSKWQVNADSFSVDKIMIHYYGQQGSKQFIHGKSTQYGFMVWVACTSGGLEVWLDPYCGKDAHVEDQGLGCGPNIVLDLVLKARITKYMVWYWYLCFQEFCCSFSYPKRLFYQQVCELNFAPSIELLYKA
jgi:hypothetical protein